MTKEETLQRIKHAEAQIRAAKEAAERDREGAVRNARREALELLEKFREQSEARFREIVAGAEAAVESEREKMLVAARVEGERVSDRGKTNVGKAVDLVLGKFRGTIHA